MKSCVHDTGPVKNNHNNEYCINSPQARQTSMCGSPRRIYSPRPRLSNYYTNQLVTSLGAISPNHKSSIKKSGHLMNDNYHNDHPHASEEQSNNHHGHQI